MTTSSQQTSATAAPLDLRTRPRNGKSGEEGGVNHTELGNVTGHNGHPADNGKVKVEDDSSYLPEGPDQSNGLKKTSSEVWDHPSRPTAVTAIREGEGKSLLNPEDGTLSPRPTTICTTAISAKHQTDISKADCDSKSKEISVSRLPIRKRPFPAGQDTTGQSRTPPARSHSQSPVGPSLAKVPKRNTPGPNGPWAPADLRQVHPSSQEDRTPSMVDPYQQLPAIAPFFPFQSYTLVQAIPTPGVFINVPVTPLPYHHHPGEEPGHMSLDVAMATRQDDDGDTALHIAVVQGVEDMVHRLIYTLKHSHKDLDIYNNLRQTPLHLAVITDQAALVEALLRAGSDPEALDRHGQTAAHLCCEHGLSSCLQLILHHASRPPCLEARNYEGLTPLHLAVQNGNKKLVKILLDNQADIDAVDIKSGRSPLMHAVENNSMEMVNLLVENGCNVNAQSYSGNTALHSACGRGQVEAVRVLMRNGADSSLKNYHNDTPLMVAKNKKVTDVLRGKGSRSQNPKPPDHSSAPSSPQGRAPHLQQQSANGTPRQSPTHTLHRSPLATPNHMVLPLHHSPSQSPRAPPTHSPLSQSAESRSGGKSPMVTEDSGQQQLQLVVVHPTGDPRHRLPYSILPVTPGCGPYQPPMPECHMGAIIPNYPPYATASFPRPFYNPYFQASIPNPTNHSPLLHHPGQSRPSSHGSDQSDVSTMSISSGGKGEN